MPNDKPWESDPVAPWDADPVAPHERALAGAETIGAAPWYTRNLGPLPSVTQTLSALPAVGGFVGGLVGATGAVPSTGGLGTPLAAAAGAAAGGGLAKTVQQGAFRLLGGKPPESPVKEQFKEAGIQGGAELAGGALGLGLRAGGRRLMHSALKPNPSMLKEYQTTAPKVVKTLLDEGVNVTPGGIEKLQKLLNSTNDEIRQLVRNAPGEIDKADVAKRVLPTAGRMAQQVNPQKALKDVGKTVDRFMQHPLYPGKLSVPEAQAMKVGTYKQIGKDYGKLSNASVETQKALARGLREEIEAKAPGVAELNARDARLMAALDATGHRVAIAGNRDPVGFAWVASNPQTFLAALMDRSPVIKSMLARGMYQSAGKAAKVSPQLIRAAVVALASDESDGEPARQ